MTSDESQGAGVEIWRCPLRAFYASAKEKKMMRRCNLVLTLLFASALLVVSVGATPTKASPSAESKVVGIALPNITSPFFLAMANGAKKILATKGYTALIVNGNNDPSLQASQLESLIAKKVAGIIIDPVDQGAALPFVQKARSGGIFVVAVDRGMKGVNSFVEADNRLMGVLNADRLADILTKRYGSAKGTVGELAGRAGVQATIDRGGGFHSQLKKYPGIKIVASQDTQFDAGKGFSIAQNMLSAHPELDAFYAHSDIPMSGAVRALQSQRKLKPVGAKGHVILVSIDGDNWAITQIKKGVMDLTVSQDPLAIGRRGAQDILDLVGGKKVVAHTKLAPVVVWKSCPKNPKYLCSSPTNPALWGSRP